MCFNRSQRIIIKACRCCWSLQEFHIANFAAPGELLNRPNSPRSLPLPSVVDLRDSPHLCNWAEFNFSQLIDVLEIFQTCLFCYATRELIKVERRFNFLCLFVYFSYIFSIFFIWWIFFYGVIWFTFFFNSLIWFVFFLIMKIFSVKQIWC